VGNKQDGEKRMRAHHHGQLNAIGSLSNTHTHTPSPSVPLS
jgi:hypothetical protein